MISIRSIELLYYTKEISKVEIKFSRKLAYFWTDFSHIITHLPVSIYFKKLPLTWFYTIEKNPHQKNWSGWSKRLVQSWRLKNGKNFFLTLIISSINNLKFSGKTSSAVSWKLPSAKVNTQCKWRTWVIFRWQHEITKIFFEVFFNSYNTTLTQKFFW